MTDTITPETLLAGIRRWVEIESHTPDLEGIERLLRLIETDYAALGAQCERAPGRDGLGDHLIVRAPWNAGATGILLLSHIDTVHPRGTLQRMPFRVEDGSAYGPGIYDMKGGAYIAHHAFGRVLAQAPAGQAPVTHLLVSDEEVGSPTSRALIERLAGEASVVLVTEPAREGGRIVTARKGVARYDITVRGRAAHAGARHQDGRNAILEMARQVIALEGMTDYEAGVTINVGTITGGTGVNVVPAECTIRVEARLPDPAAAKVVCARIEALAPHDPDTSITVTGGLNRPPYEKSPEIARLFEHARALADAIGFELRDLKTGGCSDGNFTAAIAPTLDGLGVDGHGGHSDDEQLYIGSLVPREALIHRLLTTLR